ncbi:MAG: ThiF family adenylyltransferase [archaeon]
MDYRRQGVFDQERLRSAKIAIIGAGPLAHHAAAYLAGLGTGSSANGGYIRILGSASPGFAAAASCLENTVRQINDETAIESLPLIDKTLLKDCDVILELTNDPAVKKWFQRLSLPACTHLAISGSSTQDLGIMVNGQEPQFPFQLVYLGKQAALTSSIIAALAVQAVREAVSPLDGDKPVSSILAYAQNKFYLGEDAREYLRSRQISQRLHRPHTTVQMDREALVIGAGGAGTFVSLILSLLGGKMDIFDADIIEEHNRNRQIFYYGAEGSPKGSTLAARLQKITPRADIRGYDEFIDYACLKRLDRAYDVVFCCADKWAARRDASRFALTRGIPLVTGAISAHSAESEMFVPGANACIDCRYNLDDLLDMDNARVVRCADLNAIVNNVIVAGFMVAQYLNYLRTGFANDLKQKYYAQNVDERKFTWIPLGHSCLCDTDLTRCSCHSYAGM